LTSINIYDHACIDQHRFKEATWTTADAADAAEFEVGAVLTDVVGTAILIP
jgi:hypothetical protein